MASTDPSAWRSTARRSDIGSLSAPFAPKLGYGAVAEIEGNKLEIDFEQSGRKRVPDSL